MANTYDDILPRILGRSITRLRAQSILPRLSNRSYEGPAAAGGSTVNVEIEPTMAAVDVTPSASQPANTETTWTTISVPLSYHKEVAFHLTDVQRIQIPGSPEERAIDKASATLCDAIDASIMTMLDVGAGIATGSAGTAPFATLALAQQPITYLDAHKSPRMDRHVVMDAIANGSLKGLSQFTSLDYVPDLSNIREGAMAGNRNLGANWWMNQNCPRHTAGSGSAYELTADHAVGATTITVDTGSGTILAGDVVTFAGDTANKYVVATALSGGSFTIAAPGLKVALPNNNVVTVAATHTSNFAFQRDALVFVSRQFKPSAAAVAMEQVTDPMTGLTVRVEVTRQNKQDKWSIDAQWGGRVIESRSVVKIMG